MIFLRMYKRLFLGDLMKIKQNLYIWLAVSVVTVLLFQNCGQQGELALKVDPESIGGGPADICEVNPSHSICTNIPPVGKVEEYRYIDVKQPTIPDLKIFLILDNSDSMRVSQVNLVNNIGKMFSANGEGLKDYNSEIFIITTAQLNNINNSLSRTAVDNKNAYQKVLEKVYEVQNLSLINQLLPSLRPIEDNLLKTNGLLAGDMVGFSVRSKRTPSSLNADKKYDALELSFAPAYLANLNQPSIFSVQYKKGQSIDSLVSQIRARVELLDPDRQVLSQSLSVDTATVDNVPLSDVVEKESGLCALGRVLHEVKNNPSESLIKKGELATFIVVSDEPEHDLNGLECVKSAKFQQPLPGTLYKGDCADTEANLNYEIPDKKTWSLKVKKPYVKYVRQVHEHVDGEIQLRNGKCDVQFKQSLARMKINKNTHTVKFDRKVMESNGTDMAVRSWTHDLKFDRISKKHNVVFDRVTHKHKIKFDRNSKKYQLSFDRKKVTPKFSVNIERNKIAKFQKVTYVRKTYLIKEGNKKVEVATTGVLNHNEPGVNFASASSCTPSWVAGLSAIKALAAPLSSASQVYEYIVQGCVVANISTVDNKILNYSGMKPSVCDNNYAKVVYPEGSLLANESMEYKNVSCAQLADYVASSTIILNFDGDTPALASCNASFASGKDSAKPSLDGALNESLSYENVICTNKDAFASNVEITSIDGDYSASDLLAYVKLKDGNKSNVEYTNYSYTNTPSTVVNQKVINIPGVYSGNNLNAYAATQDGNKANTTYENVSIQSADTTALAVSLTGIAGKYSFTSNADLLNYIKSKDGNKANTEYANNSYNNIPAHMIDTNLTVAGIDEKKPSKCDADYAQSKDSNKPTISNGQTIVYYNVSCTDTPSSFQISRNNTIVKYDGVYGNLAIPFESLTAPTERNCSDAEINLIKSNEAKASPTEFVIDGKKLEYISCRVYNSIVSWDNANKTNILSKINGLTSVKTSTNASACDKPIADYCASDAVENPRGELNCSNNISGYVSYIAYKPEYRKYSVKPPVFDLTANKLYWFGFEPVVYEKTPGVATSKVTISLLTKKCSEVVGACSNNIEDQDLTVEQYFMKTYANNNMTIWNSIVKVSISDQTVSNPATLAACALGVETIAGYETCYDRSKNASDYILYDTADSEILITKNNEDQISCNEVCDSVKCATKSGSTSVIPFDGKTMKDFYGNNCSVGNYVSSGSAKRVTAKINLMDALRDNTLYNDQADVCNLSCKTSGLCKLSVNSAVDLSDKTIKEYLAEQNSIDPSKVVSCKVVRNGLTAIMNKQSRTDLENSCIKPAGQLLVGKYIKNVTTYDGASANGINEFSLVKESHQNLETYINSTFTNVLGDGFVNMASFSSQALDTNGKIEGDAYDRISRGVDGVVKDVKSSSDQYGDALKFLGIKVASQLSSSFQLKDVAPSQNITRVWYSSWFTGGKYVQLNPADFSASAATLVITNPAIIDKMKNEAAFKFFVEIY